MKAAELENGYALTTGQRSMAWIVAHPVRRRCWSRLAEVTASPKELADYLLLPLPDVSYHVRELLKGGAIEAVDYEHVRGAKKTYYRSVQRPCFDDEETSQLSPDEQIANARHCAQLAFADISDALDAKTFCSRSDHAVCRYPLQLDEEGWRKLASHFYELNELIMDVQAESAERMAKAGEDAEGIPVGVFVSLFERPAPRHPGRSPR